MKTHWKKLWNPDFLGSYALEEDKDLIVTIQAVKTDMVKNADGKEEECIVLELVNQKPLVLNATNGKNVTKALGSPYIEDWTGRSVALYIAKVKAFGEVVDAIRVRPVAPRIEKRKLNDDEFSKLLTAVKNGTRTKADSLTKYDLTAAQTKHLNEI